MQNIYKNLNIETQPGWDISERVTDSGDINTVWYTTAEIKTWSDERKIAAGILIEDESVPITINLDDLLAQKNAEINTARLMANQTNFTFQGKAIACDPLSRGDIDAMNGMVTLLNDMPSGWLGAWKAADNSMVEIPDVVTWIEFYGAMVNQGLANFYKSQILKHQLQAAYAASDTEAMQAVSWA